MLRQSLVSAQSFSIALAAMCLAQPRAAAAQVAGGSISGTVVDQHQAAVPGATLTASAPPVGKTTVSGGDGTYRLVNLAPGTYTVTSELPGFTKLVRENVIVREGLNLTLDLTMAVGEISETVDVRGDSPLLESKTAAEGINISGDLQRALPLSALRTWADALTLVPGVNTLQSRFQSNYLFGTIHMSGVALVDGADATSVLQGSTAYTQFGRDAFSDIQVKTGGVDASTPLGLGAVMTAASQSGTDRFSGAVAFQYEPREWNADNTPGGQSSTVKTQQTDFSLGGPIVRSEAWFFGSGRIARNATGNPQSSLQADYLRALQPGYAPLDNDWNNEIVFVKGTWQPVSRHQVLGSYSRDTTTYGGIQPNEAGFFRTLIYGGPSAFARWSSTWSDALATRVSVGYNGRAQTTKIEDPSTSGIMVYQSTTASGGRVVGVGPLGVLASSAAPGVDFPVHAWTTRADATYYKLGWAGSHELNAGVYVQPRHNEQDTVYSNSGHQLTEAVLRNPQNPAAGYVPFHQQIYSVSRLTTLNVDSHDNALYVQDAWRPSTRLTVSPGLRVDFVKRTDQIFDVVTQRSTEVAPRIGVNYSLTSDAKNVVRASWGRVFDNLTVNETTAGTSRSGFVDLYDPKLDGSFGVSFVTPPATTRSTNINIDLDNYHQPRMDEFIAGYQRQLPRQTMVEASFIRREYRKRPAAVETNGIYNGNVFVGYKDPSQNQIYTVTANTWNYPVVNALQIDASSHTSRLQLIASYTHQWDSLDGTWQPNDPASFIQPSAFPNSSGVGQVYGCTAACSDGNSYTQVFGGQWVTNLAHAGITYALPWDMQVATTYTYQSGLWSGPILKQLAAPDPAFGPPTVTLSNGRVVSNPLATPVRFAYDTREQGQFQLKAMQIWNIRVGRTFALPHGRLEGAADVFNITNHDADQSVQSGTNQLYSPFYGIGQVRQFPRALQLSARYLF